MGNDNLWMECNMMPDKSTGRVRVTGHTGLKASQEYPKQYAEAVAEYFVGNRANALIWIAQQWVS